VGYHPSAIKIARWKNTRAQEHADVFPRVVAHVDLKIKVHALTVVAAVLIVVDVDTKCDVLAVWNAVRVRASCQGGAFGRASCGMICTLRRAAFIACPRILAVTKNRMCRAEGAAGQWRAHTSRAILLVVLRPHRRG
jgi:hypothetical protein